MTADLIKALNHPIRRSILRLLLRSGAASPSDARRELTKYIAPSLVNFHLDALVEAGAVVRSGQTGSRGDLYTCSKEVIRAGWLLIALDLTAAEDNSVDTAYRAVEVR